jgi:hypothetical protein
MLLVKSVEVINVRPGSYCTVDCLDDVIQGRRFINANGDEICIGMAKEVQTAIGLPLECYEKLSATIDRKNSTINEYQRSLTYVIQRLNRYRTMGLLERIRFLFRGGTY